jgi:SAM-dependent methyltransferase
MHTDGFSLYQQNDASGDIDVINADFTIETDLELINKSNLGKRNHICKLCGAAGDFQTWACRENFLGFKDEFIYFICPMCEVMQITDIPQNMDRYYPHDYYSYVPPVILPAKPGVLRDKRMVLDVGCGSGSWLCELAANGYVNLFGCDPFIEKNITYANGVKIKKRTIHEMDGVYDCIYMYHSFEHMSDPHEVFTTLQRLLRKGVSENGIKPFIHIQLPVFPNLAFDLYGPYWYQLDSPRHFFIHSQKSIQLLAEANGFKITNIVNGCLIEQFTVSRLSQLGVPFVHYKTQLEENPKYADLKTKKPFYEALAKCALAAGCTDQLYFMLERDE